MCYLEEERGFTSFTNQLLVIGMEYIIILHPAPSSPRHGRRIFVRPQGSELMYRNRSHFNQLQLQGS